MMVAWRVLITRWHLISRWLLITWWLLISSRIASLRHWVSLRCHSRHHLRLLSIGLRICLSWHPVSLCHWLCLGISSLRVLSWILTCYLVLSIRSSLWLSLNNNMNSTCRGCRLSKPCHWLTWIHLLLHHWRSLIHWLCLLHSCRILLLSCCHRF